MPRSAKLSTADILGGSLSACVYVSLPAVIGRPLGPAMSSFPLMLCRAPVFVHRHEVQSSLVCNVISLPLGWSSSFLPSTVP